MHTDEQGFLMQSCRSPVIRRVLDLTRYHFRQRHGDITVYGTWWLGDEGPWSCLVLVPSFRETRGCVPCVVSIDLAWIWSEEHGSPAFAAETAMDFAETLGIGARPRSAVRVAMIIRDHLEDLLKIPPRPAVRQHHVGDIVITERESGKARHAEIRDDV